jgi:hypothetical protein
MSFTDIISSEKGGTCAARGDSANYKLFEAVPFYWNIEKFDSFGPPVNLYFFMQIIVKKYTKICILLCKTFWCSYGFFMALQTL